MDQITVIFGLGGVFAFDSHIHTHTLRLPLLLPVALSFFFGFLHSQLAAGLCCGLSCLAAGGTIGILGDVGVRAFGLTAENGNKWFWDPAAAAVDGGGIGGDGEDGGGTGGGSGVVVTTTVVPIMSSSRNPIESANKLYVGMLIMLIFSEALALYGLIVALILSQHNYLCSN